MLRIFVITVLCVNIVSGSKHLPSYIKACKIRDPNLTECAKRHGQEALQQLLKGDKTYKIPSYLPFELALVNTISTSGVKFQLKDVHVYGLNETEIKDIDFDFKNQKIVVKVFIPNSITEATYFVDGKIFSLSIKGEGPSKITSTGVLVEYTINYTLITKKDGKRYIDANNLKTDIKVDTEKTHYYFGNLFGGNKVLGDSFNMVLNENAQEVDGISADTNTSVINSIVITVIKPLFNAVPYDEIFIDE